MDLEPLLPVANPALVVLVVEAQRLRRCLLAAVRHLVQARGAPARRVAALEVALLRAYLDVNRLRTRLQLLHADI